MLQIHQMHTCIAATVDGSSSSLRALDAGAELANLFGAHLLIICATSEPGVSTEIDLALRRAQTIWPCPSRIVRPSGNLPDCILDAASDAQASLILATATGAGSTDAGHGGVLMGHISQALVQRAMCSVMIVK